MPVKDWTCCLSTLLYNIVCFLSVDSLALIKSKLTSECKYGGWVPGLNFCGVEGLTEKETCSTMPHPHKVKVHCLMFEIGVSGECQFQY